MRLEIILILSKLVFSMEVSSSLDLTRDIQYLTDIFFSNIKEVPYLKQNGLNDISKDFINKQLFNYMDMMKQTLDLSASSRKRRSLSPVSDNTTDGKGFYTWNGFLPLYEIPSKHSKDIVLFSKNENNGESFAASLEGNNTKEDDFIVIYKFTNSSFTEINRIQVANSLKLAVYPIKNVYLIMSAGLNDNNKTLDKVNALYAFDGIEVKQIQNVKGGYMVDVHIWEQHGDIFMSLAEYKRFNSYHQTYDYELSIPIYKWKGRHFDIIQDINTSGVKKIMFFSIRSFNFIAVANFKNNLGNTKVYSEIYKYNLHTERYELHQKILTNAAVDVKHFFIEYNLIREDYLVYANFYEEDINGNPNYMTNSVLYKYVDGYFVPFQSFLLNGANEWLPIIVNKNLLVLLVVCKFESIRVFQYDGWKFIESAILYHEKLLSSGITSMHYYQIGNQSLVVVANENNDGNMANVFQPVFKYQEFVNTFQEETLFWCQNQLLSLKTPKINKLTKRVSEAPKMDDPEIKLLQAIKFDNITIDNFHSLDLNATATSKLEGLEQNSELANAEIEEIKNKLNFVMQTNKVNVIEGNVFAKKLVVNGASQFNIVNTETVNGIEVIPILEDIIYINTNLATDYFECESAEVRNSFIPEFINGRNILQSSNETSYNLVIKGDAFIQNGFSITGTLNGMNFRKSNIMLNNSTQDLKNLQVSKLNVQKLKVNYLNNITSFHTRFLGEESFDTLENLHTKNLIVNGYINNIDIPSLDKYTLKTSGNQILYNLVFNSLHVNEVITNEGVQNQIKDVVQTKGQFTVEHAIQIKNDLIVKVLHVNNRLNNINIINGTLDILLDNFPNIQYISGYKEFENVQLLKPIQLRGHITTAQVDKIRPFIVINDELLLEGDFTIAGTVEIEENLKANNLQSLNNMNLQHLLQYGLRLDENVLSTHLKFTQQLHIPRIFCDKINHLNISSLVITDMNKPQVITAKKEFTNNAAILGSTRLNNVNDINIEELEKNVLKTHGEQTLTGKYHFENVVIDRLYSIKINIGNTAVEDLIRIDEDQFISGTTLFDTSIEADHLDSPLITTKTINEYDFTKLVEDTVLRNKLNEIRGKKDFLLLQAGELHLINNLDDMLEQIKNQNATFVFEEDIELPEGIVINTITFENQFNKIPGDRFRQHWKIDGNDPVVTEDIILDKMIIYRELFISSGILGNTKIDDINLHSLKIDEPFTFSRVTFANGLASETGVSLSGQFESLDVNEIVQVRSGAQQIIQNKLTFADDVVIFGNMYFNGMVSQVNISNMCMYFNSLGNGKAKSLQINGNVHFTTGPEIYRLHNREVNTLLEDIWFKTNNVELSGRFDFEDIVFKDNVIISGFVDGTKLELVAQTYFSKSRNQSVSASFHIDEKVLFGNGITVPRANVGGTCGLGNLETFMRTAILKNYKQVFENRVYLDECDFLYHQGDYFINGMNLETDVMRYNGTNHVTGKMTFKNINAVSLKLPESRQLSNDVRIQGVELLQWLTNSVQNRGNYEISGGLAFHNTTKFEKGIRTNVLRRKPFDNTTVLLKSINQTVTGKKNFMARVLEENKRNNQLRQKTVNFQSLNATHINTINMTDLMKYQVYSDHDTIFNNVVNFKSNISMTGAIFHDLHQHINVSNMLESINHLELEQNYLENYSNIFNISIDIKKSVEDQAYLLQYYVIKKIYQMTDLVLPVQMNSNKTQYLAKLVKGDINYTIQFDVWNADMEYFHQDDQIAPIMFNKRLHYIIPLKFKGTDVWYIEHINDFMNSPAKQFGEFEGTLYRVQFGNLIPILPPIFHTGSQTVTDLVIPRENKQCIVIIFKVGIDIVCEEMQNSKPHLQLYQQLSKLNPIEVVATLIEEEPFLFIINRGIAHEQPTVEIWKFDNAKKFLLWQVIYVSNPVSISVTLHNRNHYLAIASGHVKDTRHTGMVDIRRLDEETKKFNRKQQIPISAPVHVYFSHLPSEELILYISTDNPTQPLTIYNYLGIFGFSEKLKIPVLPKISRIIPFTFISAKLHFVLIYSESEIRILQALFK